MKGHVSKLMDAWINEWMNEVIHDWEKNELMNKYITKGIKDGKMDGWQSEWIYIKKKKLEEKKPYAKEDDQSIKKNIHQ